MKKKRNFLIISVIFMVLMLSVTFSPGKYYAINDVVHLLTLVSSHTPSYVSKKSDLAEKVDERVITYPQALLNSGQKPNFPGRLIPASYTSVNQGFILGDTINIAALRVAPSTNLLDPLAPHDVSINLAGNNQINLSDPIILSGVLKDVTVGAGVADKSIKFYTNGSLLAQTHTNNDGSYQVKITKSLPAGKYQVTATFTGAHLLSAASANMTFDVLPATVKVQTVPAIEGITFQMDGRTFVSGPDGMASIQISQEGQYNLDVLLDKYSNPSQQVKFGRWTEETYQTSRLVKVPDSDIIQVGLNVYHKVNLKFMDLSSYPVDSSRISAITIRSIQGDFFTLKPGDTPWLPAIRTARRQTGLEKTDLLYSVDSVTIDGSNVVNSAQQRFYAKIDDTWEISLLLYSMHISAKDALLRKPVGTSVDVVFPNGQTVNYPLNQSGIVDLHALARGNYHVNLVGARGMGTSTPVALSRNQVVNLKIVTKLDMILFMATSGSFALGLVIYGRPWLLHLFSGKKRARFSQASKDFGG